MKNQNQVNESEVVEVEEWAEVQYLDDPDYADYHSGVREF